MCYDELPPRYKAVKSIKKQPFYGRDTMDFVIEYIWSHALWYVGDYQGLMDLRSQCAKEYIEMIDKGGFPA